MASLDSLTRRELFSEFGIPAALLTVAAASGSLGTLLGLVFHQQELTGTRSAQIPASPSAEEKVAYAVKIAREAAVSAGITEYRPFSGESARLAKAAKEKFGVELLLPRQWINDDGTTVLNLDWRPEEIAVISRGLELMPPIYITEKLESRILLVRPLGTKGGVGGWHREETVIINTPDGFTLSQSPGSPVFPNIAAELTTAAIHEFTHGYTNQHPEVMDR